MIRQIAFIAALVVAPMAAAQTTKIENVSAAQLAEARAEGDALIAGTGDGARFFENVSSDGMVRIRHKPSGLLCTFVPGAQNNTLLMFPGGLPAGDDVGCNADIGPVYLTYYATRYGPGYSAQDSARDAAVSIRNRFASARPYQGSVAQVSPPAGVTETAFAAFTIEPEAPRYTHAATAKVGEWIFKQRMTGDGSEASIMANQVVAGAFFNEILATAVDAQR